MNPDRAALAIQPDESPADRRVEQAQLFRPGDRLKLAAFARAAAAVDPIVGEPAAAAQAARGDDLDREGIGRGGVAPRPVEGREQGRAGPAVDPADLGHKLAVDLDRLAGAKDRRLDLAGGQGVDRADLALDLDLDRAARLAPDPPDLALDRDLDPRAVIALDQPGGAIRREVQGGCSSV